MPPDQVFNIYVRRPSGLLEIFEPPELTISAAVSRGWEIVGPILRPRPPEFLPTYPMPWGNIPHDWRTCDGCEGCANFAEGNRGNDDDAGEES